jgi:hypothetical protein
LRGTEERERERERERETPGRVAFKEALPPFYLPDYPEFFANGHKVILRSFSRDVQTKFSARKEGAPDGGAFDLTLSRVNFTALFFDKISLRVNMTLHIYRRLNLTRKSHVHSTVYLFDKIVDKFKIYLRKDHVKHSPSLHALLRDGI